MRHSILTVLLFSLFLHPAMAQGVTFYAEATDVYVESPESAGTLDLLFSDATGRIPYVSSRPDWIFSMEKGNIPPKSKIELLL